MALDLLAARVDFAHLLSQHARLLQLHTHTAPDAAAPDTAALVPQTLHVREGVNELFRIEVEAVSTSAHLTLETFIGTPVTVGLMRADGRYRHWHGYATSAQSLGADGGLARYRLVLEPWLAFLARRRDTFLYQGQPNQGSTQGSTHGSTPGISPGITAREIIEDLFKDHPQASWRWDATQALMAREICTQYRESDLAFVQRLLAEEGLSYRFEHAEGVDSGQGTDPAQAHTNAHTKAQAQAQARHCLVISDAQSLPDQQRDLGALRFALPEVGQRGSLRADTVTAFSAARQVTANALTLGAWAPARVSGTAATGQGDKPEAVPVLEVYQGQRTERFADGARADAVAQRELAARQSPQQRFDAESNVRHLIEGARFTLAEHYSSGPGAGPGAGRDTFTVLTLEHQAANNLGPELARHLGTPELEHGSYRNRFTALDAERPVLPHPAPKPIAPGMQSAVVVGTPDQGTGTGIHTERDARVKVQFPWQRGTQPLPGGLAHDERSAEPTGNAPGQSGSGTWVRVAQPSAGANWGAMLLPRVGGEVLVGFIGGDIDRPVIAAQLYNRADTLPYAAGVDSGINHPGVLSGLYANTLDGGGAASWVIDDATGQARMRLLCSASAAELSLGHLIQQSATSANRGASRGSGFEARSDAWVTVRAAEGLLVSSTARPQRGTSVASTQMDSAEALAQLRAAQSLGKALGDAAGQQQASGLPSHQKNDKAALEQLIAAIDPKRDGKYGGEVHGQEAGKADPGSRTLQGPVEKFAKPIVVLDTPSTLSWATPGSVLGFAGQDQSWVAHGDVQFTAAKTLASVSGETMSLYAHAGGCR